MKIKYQGVILIRPCSIKELANLYKVSPYVMKKWLKLINKYIGDRQAGYYNIKQVKLIFDHFGTPGLQAIVEQ